jgi:hypothetical protein
VVVLTDLQRRMLALLTQCEKIPADEFFRAVCASPEEFASAARSLGEEGLLLAIVPLGGPDIRLQGAWAITPRGREALRAASESL